MTDGVETPRVLMLSSPASAGERWSATSASASSTSTRTNRPGQSPGRDFAVVAGVIAGHRNGPEAPDPYPAGTMAAGGSRIALEYTTTIQMGFDPSRFPILREGFGGSRLPLPRFAEEDVVMSSNDSSWIGAARHFPRAECHHFEPHLGWADEPGNQTARSGRDGAHV